VAPGDGVWYLVRGTGCCGSWSYDTFDAAQVGTSDPEIAASAMACP
jgi:hypothetical protein